MPLFQNSSKHCGLPGSFSLVKTLRFFPFHHFPTKKILRVHGGCFFAAKAGKTRNLDHGEPFATRK